MTAVSPAEAFPLESARARGLRTVRLGNGAMIAGTAALIAGTLIEMGGGFLVAHAPSLFLTVGPLEGPLVACGEVLLVGGAIAARLARRRMQRSTQTSATSSERGGER